MLVTNPTSGPNTQGGRVDFSAKFDELQTLLVEAKAAAEAAATESRDRLKQQIDAAQQGLDRAAAEVEQEVSETDAAKAKSKWAQLRADAAAWRSDVRAQLEQGTRELDAEVAAEQAEWADADASAALDFVGWAIDNARVDVLAAVYSHAYADEHAT
jgi:uncharacterized protein YhaN